MNELENLNKQIDGIQAKIQLQKAKNQKIQNDLNSLIMTRDTERKEVTRLKNNNIELENSVKEKQNLIKETESKNLLDELIKKLD